MSKITDRFVQELRAAPAPSRELAVNGAYPRLAGEHEWAADMELIAPVLKGYFARSKILSKDTMISGNGRSQMSFFRTSEWNYAEVLRDIANAGDAFIGTGSALSFTFAAHAGSDHAFVVNNDSFVPFGLIPLLGVMTAMAPTRARFVSLAFGVPLYDRYRTRFAEMQGEDILEWFDKRSYDPLFSITTRRMIARAVAEAGSNAGVSYLIENGLAELLSRPAEIERLKGGLLASEAAYARERDVFLHGRITGVKADITGAALRTLLGALKATGLSPGLLYLLDIEGDVFGGTDFGNEGRRIWRLYRNLGAISRAAASNPAVVSALDLYHPAVFGLRDYIDMSIPMGARREEAVRAASEFFPLRRNILAVRRAGNRPRMLLDMVNYELGTVSKRLVGDAGRVAGGEPSAAPEFHARMMSRSGTYRGLGARVKRMFLLNMRALGVVKKEPAASVGALTETGEEIQRPSGRGGYLSTRGRMLSPVEHRPSLPARAMPHFLHVFRSSGLILGGPMFSSMATRSPF